MQEDDLDGLHIVAFAEEEDPGTYKPYSLFCWIFDYWYKFLGTVMFFIHVMI